jgi:hypothetical protein
MFCFEINMIDITTIIKNIFIINIIIFITILIIFFHIFIAICVLIVPRVVKKIAK